MSLPSMQMGFLGDFQDALAIRTRANAVRWVWAICIYLFMMSMEVSRHHPGWSQSVGRVNVHEGPPRGTADRYPRAELLVKEWVGAVINLGGGLGAARPNEVRGEGRRKVQSFPERGGVGSSRRIAHNLKL